MSVCASFSGQRAARADSRSLPIAAGDLLLGATFVWLVIPESLTGDIYISSIPLRFCLFYISTAVCVASSLLTGVSRTTRFFKVTLVLTVGMALLGLWRGNEFKFWVLDCSTAMGLLLGLYWANRYTLRYTLNTLFLWTSAITCVLALNLIGLCGGWVAQAGSGDRVYSYSLFVSAAFVTWFFPLWATIQTRGPQADKLWHSRLLAVGSITSVLFATLISATRSMFLSAVAAVLLVVWLKMRGRDSGLWTAAVLFLAAVVAWVVFGADRLAGSYFSDRLASTEIREEERFVELEWMFEQLEGGWLTGKGFGSRFESPTTIDGESLAYAPHVAIFTLLYKGGIIPFFVILLAPLAAAGRSLLHADRRPAAAAFAAAALLYGVQASMSGGWEFAPMFLYGVAVALMFRCDRLPLNDQPPNPRLKLV